MAKLLEFPHLGNKVIPLQEESPYAKILYGKDGNWQTDMDILKTASVHRNTEKCMSLYCKIIQI